MPIIGAKGSPSSQGFGEFAKTGTANYIEDVFSTYLTTGTGVSNTQTVSNGVNLSTYGGLVWGKRRNGADDHILVDTARGVNTTLSSNNTGAQITSFPTVSSFLSNGFTATNYVNSLSDTFAFWTFRKQPKFYTQGTYTGNGTGTSIGSGVLKRDIAHDLGSTPGCVIIKNLDTGNWVVYHRSSAFGTENLRLNTTGAGFNASGYAPIYEVSSTTFSVIVGATGLSSNDNCNINGASYVYYIFAHNAGGFGLTGTDNVISCGSFTTPPSGPATVTLGYEPQWTLIKKVSNTGNWWLEDTMRGMPVSGNGALLYADLSNAEANATFTRPTATGFTHSSVGEETFIYIAIRRGPMKVPTSGTSVFAPVLTTTNNTITTNFPVDLSIFRADRGTTASNFVFDRLRGNTARLITSTTAAEATATAYPLFDSNTGTALTGFTAGLLGVDWAFRRAPSFFDEVCYPGTGTQNAKQHNLTVAPEMIIVKKRTSVGGLDGWWVYHKDLPTNYVLQLNSTSAKQDTSGYTYPFFSSVNASTFTVGSSDQVNASGENYGSWMWATCTGVSKVGSYTGNGSSQTINCGFTSGARFILIKRTDAASPWYVWDTARGIVAGNDPYLLLNSSVAEVQGYDDVDTASTGFIVNYYVGGATDINTSGGTYIFLAIA